MKSEWTPEKEQNPLDIFVEEQMKQFAEHDMQDAIRVHCSKATVAFHLRFSHDVRPGRLVRA